MSKKYFIGGLLICIALALVTLIGIKALNKKSTAHFPQVMPFFEAIYTNGKLFSSDSLESSNIVLVFYSPGCMFCEHEGKEMANNASVFAENQLLFVTCAPIDSAAAYTQRTRIGAIPHFYSLVDTSLIIPRLFGLRSIPTTLLYDEHRRFVMGFEGEVNAAKLGKTMRNYEGNNK